MFEAIRRGDAEAFRALIGRHPEEARHPDGRSKWLSDAARNGALPIVELIVSSGADVDEPTYPEEGRPEGALDMAAVGGHVEVIRWLLDRGARVNHMVDGGARCFALVSAVLKGHLAAVKLLVERGAAVNSAWAEMTPLDHAEMGGQREVAAYLRAVGANRASELG